MGVRAEIKCDGCGCVGRQATVPPGPAVVQSMRRSLAEWGWAVNDDPKGVLCDVCLQKDKVERLERERDALLGVVRVACMWRDSVPHDRVIVAMHLAAAINAYRAEFGEGDHETR